MEQFFIATAPAIGMALGLASAILIVGLASKLGLLKRLFRFIDWLFKEAL